MTLSKWLSLLQDSAHRKMRVNKISNMLKLCSPKPARRCDQNGGSGPFLHTHSQVALVLQLHILGLLILWKLLFFYLNLWATNVRNWALVSKIFFSYGTGEGLGTRKVKKNPPCFYKNSFRSLSWVAKEILEQPEAPGEPSIPAEIS